MNVKEKSTEIFPYLICSEKFRVTEKSIYFDKLCKVRIGTGIENVIGSAAAKELFAADLSDGPKIVKTNAVAGFCGVFAVSEEGGYAVIFLPDYVGSELQTKLFGQIGIFGDALRDKRACDPSVLRIRKSMSDTFAKLRYLQSAVMMPADAVEAAVAAMTMIKERSRVFGMRVDISTGGSAFATLSAEMFGGILLCMFEMCYECAKNNLIRFSAFGNNGNMNIGFCCESKPEESTSLILQKCIFARLATMLGAEYRLSCDNGIFTVSISIKGESKDLRADDTMFSGYLEKFISDALALW